MAHIYKRISKSGKVSYRAQVRIKGHPTLSHTCKEKTKAERWARKMEIAISDGQSMAILEAKKHTLSELIDRYKKDVLSHKQKQRTDILNHLEVWRGLLGSYSLIALRPELISRARAEIALRKTPKGGNKTLTTINRYMGTLSVVLSYGYKHLEWLEVNPIEKVKKHPEPRGRTRYLDEAERKRLLDACKASPNPLLYPVVLMAITTGARRNEILSLRWEDINLDAMPTAGQAILKDTKNGEQRTITIIEPALSVMRKLKAKGKDGKYAFYARRDTGEEHPADITKSWYKVLDDVGIKDFRFHDLRHSFASYLAMANRSLAEIAELMGHKTLQMTKRYSHLSNEHKQSVVEEVIGQGIFGGFKPD